jgi:ribose transport system substrate-binding protein
MPSKVGKRPILSGLLVIALGVLLALGLAACGGGDSSSGSDTTAEAAAGGEAGGTEEPTGEAGAGGEESFGGAKPLSALFEGNQEPPPSSGPAAQKGKFVVWISCSQLVPGCAVPAETFQEAAGKLGWKTQVIDGKLNENNGLTNAIRSAIALHADAIGMIGVDCELVKGALQEAKAANVPVLGYEALDCNESGGSSEPSLFSIPSGYSKSIKSSAEWFEATGSILAEYTIDKTEGKAKTLTLNPTDDPIGEYLYKGHAAAMSRCDECETIDLPIAVSELGTSGLIGRKLETELLKNPDANSVATTYTVTALSGGGAKAVVNSGRKDDLVVTADESSVEANELIREEQGINAVVSYPLEWLGWASADLLNRYFAGEPAALEGVGFQIIDKEHNLPPEGKEYEPKIDYKAAYEKVWAG